MYTHCHPRVPFKGSGGKDLSTNAPRLRAPCHMNTRWPTERLSLSSVFTVIFTVTAETPPGRHLHEASSLFLD